MGKKKSVMTISMFLLMIAGLAFVFNSESIAGVDKSGAVATEAAGKKLNALHVPFIKNEGQTGREVKYYAKTFGGTLFVTDRGKMVYTLPKHEEMSRDKINMGGKKTRVPSAVITEELIGAEVKEIKGEAESEAEVSYFIGNDAKRHRSGVKTYQTVSLGEIYRGIELKLKAYGNNVEKLFCIKPGAKPEEIRVGVGGSKGIEVNKEGELVVETVLGEVKFTKPVAYQQIAGSRKEVAVNYILLNPELETRNSELGTCNSEPIYGFRLGTYDQTKELIIDPLLQSTYLGGSNNDLSKDNGIIIHPTTGDVYISGYTESNDFPGIAGGADTTFQSFTEVFVSRFNSALTTLYQSTYLGGSGSDQGIGIAIHPTTGDVYVTGQTTSNDFPGISGGADTTYGGYDAFVSRLNSTLTTLYQSTYLSGSQIDQGNAIVIHPSTGDVYVTGYTQSGNFPGVAGGADIMFAGTEEGFVSRLNSALTILHQSTYLGGTGNERGNGIAIHPTSGDVYVTGETTSNDFPQIAGGADATFAGGGEAFVSRLNSALTTLYQSTYLGGSGIGPDQGFGIAIHPATGDVYVTGYTQSFDFPGTAGGADTTSSAGETFISRLNSALTTLIQSTYLGGSQSDQGYGIAIHPFTGDVYVTGFTFSNDFPRIAGGAVSTFAGNWDVFVSRFNSGLTVLYQSTYLGGNNGDYGYAIAIHPATGDIYVSGITASNPFSGIAAGADTTFAGNNEGFVSRLTRSLRAKDTTLVGVYRGSTGIWYLDLNGNRAWDGPPVDGVIGWGGSPGDIPAVGDWNGNGSAKIGIYQQSTGIWYLDLNGNRAWDGPPVDGVIGWGGTPGDIPVVGDWNGTGTSKIGIYQQSTGTWYLDLNGNRTWDGPPVDGIIGWGGTPGDIPVVGDWNGTGTTKIGIYQQSTGAWFLDLNGNRTWDGSPVDGIIGWGGTPGDIPVVGDWNGTGTTKIGIYQQSTGAWFLDLNGNRTWDGSPVDGVIGWGGTPGDIPVVGDWNGTGTSKIGVYRGSTGTWYLDLNGNRTWDGCGTDACIGWGGDPSDEPVVGIW